MYPNTILSYHIKDIQCHTRHSEKTYHLNQKTGQAQQHSQLLALRRHRNRLSPNKGQISINKPHPSCFTQGQTIQNLMANVQACQWPSFHGKPFVTSLLSQDISVTMQQTTMLQAFLVTSWFRSEVVFFIKCLIC